jgi:UDP-N-acetylmuramate--alanine ligase
MIHVHFMGIGGSGASAVAAIAKAHGYKVTGCDKDIENEFTTSFNKHDLFAGHNPNHLDGVDILAITPAITSLDPDNKEIARAREQGIEVLTWQQFMGKYLEKDKFVIAICGTHGKSTTTAMVGKMLEDLNLDPTVELGATVSQWGEKNYRIGESKYFVTEADEFNDNYQATTPDITIVTTIEMDHPEYFKDLDDYYGSFEQFLSKTRGTIVANLADPGVGEVLKAVAHQTNPPTILDYSKSDFNLHLKVPGKHNLANASAVFQVGLLLGLEPEKIKQSLENFPGIGRRFELMGEVNGATIISDFGHHPTEVKVVLDAARKEYPNKKIWVLFQPHMFSRTHALFADFAKILKEAPVDGIAIFDIYPSREVDTGLVTSKQLVDEINESKKVEYSDSWEEYKKGVKKFIGSDDVVIFLGAGDTHKWAKELVNE